MIRNRRTHFWKTRLVLAVAAFACLLSASASFALDTRSPFGIRVTLKPETPKPTIQVHFFVPPECVLYAERLHFLNDAGDTLTPVKIAEPITEMDPVSKKEKQVYEHEFKAELALDSLANGALTVKFQGCSNGNCFFPEKRVFALGTNGAFAEEIPKQIQVSVAKETDWVKEMRGFKVSARQSGFLAASGFLAFLNRAVSGQDDVDDPAARFASKGLAATLCLIVLGGVLLNLTPCILPMIPINLAIIGAGSASSSRLVGFKNGAIYGTGMALAYGVLGIVVVLTGSKFGTLNSSVWFNVLIAALFVVLGLSMFDVLNIDLSRFSSRFGPQKSSHAPGHILHDVFVFIMGIMAALLAGACVAPVVISVLLLAADMFTRGHFAGLLLPFLLGAGMALPWPLAGAGIGFLPKPGKWMNRVKHGFGVIILAFAVYYGHIAVDAFMNLHNSTPLASAPSGAAQPSDANLELAMALRQAREQGLPVLVDFRASWCKNCLAMDEMVFKRPDVKKRFQDFVLVRYDAERPGEEPAKDVLNHFGVIGLPAYVVLTAGAEKPPSSTPE